MKKLLLTLMLLSSVSLSFGQTAEEFDAMASKKIEAKDFQYAMVMIDKAIALDSKNQWYMLKKAEIQFALSGPKDALKIVAKAIKLDEKNAEAYSRAGVYYDSSGMTDSALYMYNQAISRATNDTSKHSYIMNRGTARLGNRDFKGAVKDFETVLAFDPVNIAALNNVSACYGDLGMMDKSIQSLKKIIALDPSFIGPYVNLGFIYSDTDSLDLALSYFNKALAIDSQDALIYNNRGYVFYKKGDYTNALKDINLSIKLYPTNSYAYRNLALVYLAQGKTKEACSVLEYARDYGFEQRYGPEVNELIKKNCKK